MTHDSRSVLSKRIIIIIINKCECVEILICFLDFSISVFAQIKLIEKKPHFPRPKGTNPLITRGTRLTVNESLA